MIQPGLRSVVTHLIAVGIYSSDELSFLAVLIDDVTIRVNCFCMLVVVETVRLTLHSKSYQGNKSYKYRTHINKSYLQLKTLSVILRL